MLSSEQIIGNITTQQQWLAAQKQYMQYENSGYNPYASYQMGQGNRPAYLPAGGGAPPPPPNIAYSPVAAPGVIGAGLVPQVAFPNLGSAVASAFGGANPSLQTMGYMYPLAAQQQIPGLAYQQMAGIANTVGGVGLTMANFALVSKLGLLGKGVKTFGHGIASMGGMGGEYAAASGFMDKMLVSGGGLLKGAGEVPGILKNLLMNPTKVGTWAPQMGRLAGGLGMAGLGAGLMAAEFAMYKIPAMAIGAIASGEQADIGTYQTVNKFMGDTVLGGGTPTGRGITMSTAHDITSALYPKGYKFFTNQMDVMKGMSAALETGLAKAGVTDADSLKKRLVKLSDMAYKVAEAMTTSVESATKIISRWRELGLDTYNVKDVEDFSKKLKNMSVMGGVNTGTMQHLISQGSQMGRQFGLYGGLSGEGIGGGESYTMGALRAGGISEQLYRELNGGSIGPGVGSRLAMPLGRFVQSGLGQAIVGGMAAGLDIDTAIRTSTTESLRITQNNISKEGPMAFLRNKKNRASHLFKELASNPYKVYVVARRLAMENLGESNDNAVYTILTAPSIFAYDNDAAEAIISMGHQHSRIKRQELLSKFVNEDKFELGKELSQHSIGGWWRRTKKGIGSMFYEGVVAPITGDFAGASEWVSDKIGNVIYGTALNSARRDLMGVSRVNTAINSSNILGYALGSGKYNTALSPKNYALENKLREATYTTPSLWDRGLNNVGAAGGYAMDTIGWAAQTAYSAGDMISHKLFGTTLSRDNLLRYRNHSLTDSWKGVHKVYSEENNGQYTSISSLSNFGSSVIDIGEGPILKRGTKGYKSAMLKARNELLAGEDRKKVGEKYKQLVHLEDLDKLIDNIKGTDVRTRIQEVHAYLKNTINDTDITKEIENHLNLSKDDFENWVGGSGLTGTQINAAKLAYNTTAHTQKVAAVQSVLGKDLMNEVLANKLSMATDEKKIGAIVSRINPYLESAHFSVAQKEALTTAMLSKDKASLGGAVAQLKKMGIDTSTKDIRQIKEAAIDYIGQAVMGNEKYEQKQAMDRLNKLAIVVKDITTKLDSVMGKIAG